MGDFLILKDGKFLYTKTTPVETEAERRREEVLLKIFRHVPGQDNATELAAEAAKAFYYQFLAGREDAEAKRI